MSDSTAFGDYFPDTLNNADVGYYGGGPSIEDLQVTKLLYKVFYFCPIYYRGRTLATTVMGLGIDSPLFPWGTATKPAGNVIVTVDDERFLKLWNYVREKKKFRDELRKSMALYKLTVVAGILR